MAVSVYNRCSCGVLTKVSSPRGNFCCCRCGLEQSTSVLKTGDVIKSNEEYGIVTYYSFYYEVTWENKRVSVFPIRGAVHKSVSIVINSAIVHNVKNKVYGNAYH